jgi:hypothetical protein
MRAVLSPGLAEAPVLDVLCSHFVLTLTLRQAGPGRFNLRRDWNSLLSLVGRHLVWPLPVLGRVRAFLNQRCKGNPQWKGHEQLSDDAFMQRHGPWRGPYEEGTLFFYIDEYIKDAPKDLLAVLAATCEALARRLKKESTLVEKNIDALAGLLQLNRPNARCCCTARWPATSATCAGYWSNSRSAMRRKPMPRWRRSPASRPATWPRPCVPGHAWTHRHDREPDLRAEHHRPGRPDEGQRTAASRC